MQNQSNVSHLTPSIYFISSSQYKAKMKMLIKIWLFQFVFEQEIKMEVPLTFADRASIFSSSNYWLPVSLPTESSASFMACSVFSE